MALSMEQMRDQDLANTDIKSISMMRLLPGDVIYAANGGELPSVRLALTTVTNGEQQNEILEIMIDGHPILHITRPVNVLKRDKHNHNQSFCRTFSEYLS